MAAGAARLPLIGLLIGIWAIIPPYVVAFGALHVESRKEIADHLIPGIVVIATCVLGLLLVRSPTPSSLLLFMAGGVIALCGFWMTATHVPLISDARSKQVPGGAVIWHGLPGLVVLLLGVVWTILFWETDPPDEVASGS